MTNKNIMPKMTKAELTELEYLFYERAGISEFGSDATRTEASQAAAEDLGFLSEDALAYFLRVRFEELEYREATGLEYYGEGV